MDQLETAIASVFVEHNPNFAALVRQLKAAGTEKAEVVRRVTEHAGSSQLVRCGLLTLIDQIWSEQ